MTKLTEDRIAEWLDQGPRPVDMPLLREAAEELRRFRAVLEDYAVSEIYGMRARRVLGKEDR